MKTFKQFLTENTGSSIGFFPGAFKPPHKGHFDTAKQAATSNDAAVVLVSNIDRDNITASDSIAIWEIYKNYLPENLYIHSVQGSPVLTIYQITDILNNGSFTPTARAAAPLPAAVSISDYLKQFTAPYNINLYASKEDLERFKSFYGPSKNIFQGKNVQAIAMKDISRLASATDARAALAKDDKNAFLNILPDIAPESKQTIYNRLKK